MVFVPHLASLYPSCSERQVFGGVFHIQFVLHTAVFNKILPCKGLIETICKYTGFLAGVSAYISTCPSSWSQKVHKFV